jgi:hypothetical protein
MVSQKQVCMIKADTTPLRLLAIFMAVLLMGALIVGKPMPAYADDGPVITVGNAGEVKPGQEFTIPVEITGNPGFAACSLELRYDSSTLKLINIDSSGITGGSVAKNIEGNTFGFMSVNNVTGDGVLFDATFRVYDSAAIGSYGIAVALKDDSDKNLVNANGSSLGARFATGSVQVSNNAGSNSQGANNAVQEPEQNFVNATNPNGISMRLGLREQDGNLEYSLDGGGTWNRLPADGIITTDDGDRISIYGDGDADYYVKDLPDNIPPKSALQNVSTLGWVIIVIAVVLIVAAVIWFVLSRRRKKTNALLE